MAKKKKGASRGNLNVSAATERESQGQGQEGEVEVEGEGGEEQLELQEQQQQQQQQQLQQSPPSESRENVLFEDYGAEEGGRSTGMLGTSSSAAAAAASSTTYARVEDEIMDEVELEGAEQKRLLQLNNERGGREATVTLPSLEEIELQDLSPSGNASSAKLLQQQESIFRAGERDSLLGGGGGAQKTGNGGSSSSNNKKHYEEREDDTILFSSAEDNEKLLPDQYLEDDDDTKTLIIEETDSSDEAAEANDWSGAVAPSTDDPSTPAFTFRMLLLGVIWSIFLSIINTVFSFRNNAFSIPTTIAVLLSYPMGVFLQEIIPRTTILGVDLNPGPFSVKEHVLIVMMAAAAGHRPYGVDNVVGQAAEQFLNDKRINFWNSICWVLSSQMIGFGLAGMCRKFLVKPVSMLWPSTLPEIALYTSFHAHNMKPDANERYKMSRYAFFWLAFTGIFLYQWLPGYFFPAMGLVSILCFFSPNRNVRLLGSGGSFEGPGILSLSFDWAIIAHTGPLTSPFWASCNFALQYVIWGWLVIPMVYYLNPFNSPVIYGQYAWGNNSSSTDRFPTINSNRIYDRFGNPVKPVSFVTFPSLTLNETMYAAQGPFYLSSTFAIGYLCSFMNIASVVSHVSLWYGKSIIRQTRDVFYESDVKADDLHNRLMRAYVDIPDYAYFTWFLIFLTLQILVCQFTPFHMPIWSTIFAVFLGGFLTIPIGIIQAVTGAQMGLNVLTEFIIGYILPGDTVAVMTFKSLGFNVMIQALSMVKDLKISHYMHISPVSMVFSQLIGSFIGAFLNTATVFWVLDTMKVQLQTVGGDWSATGYRTFAAAGAIWGAIGPERFFGSKSPYYSLLLGFPIGLVLPFIPYLLNKVWPRKFWKYMNVPLLTSGISTGTNQAVVVIPFAMAYVFNHVLFNRRPEWWKKYNFILACALNSGAAVSTLIILFWRNVAAPNPLPPNPLNPSTTLDFYCRDASYQ